MMSAYAEALTALRAQPRTWLITGVAGFIGSHLLEKLLGLGQHVTGLDNLSTGQMANLREVEARVSAEAWRNFVFYEGTVADPGHCQEAMQGVEIVLHQAGFVSVPLSLEDPLGCHETNVTGTLHLLLAAREQGARRFVYASSSAVYGDSPAQPNREEVLGRPLSPYGASKLMGEFYAGLASEHYGLECAGLRYFNVFGPRQNPAGGYAAVIPQWIAASLRGDACRIHGDGENTRDFCPVANVVQANLLAATVPAAQLRQRAYNVALGGSTSLNELHALLGRDRTILPAAYGPARTGDIRHSSAEIARLREDFGYAPEIDLPTALAETVAWYSAAQKRS